VFFAQLTLSHTVLGRERAWIRGDDDGLRPWGRFAVWALVVSPLLAALASSSISALTMGGDFVHRWRSCDLSLAVGTALVLPLVLTYGLLVWAFALFPLLAVIAFRAGVPALALALAGLAAVGTALVSAGAFATLAPDRAVLVVSMQGYMLLAWAAAYLTGGLLFDRQRAFGQPLANESLFRQLADDAADIVFLCDDQLFIQYASPAVPVVLGREPSELSAAKSGSC